MTDLSDSFSENLRKEFSKRSIKVGTVLRFKVRDTNPPKIKLFIIIGQTIVGSNLATLYINTEVNLKVNWAQELLDLQIPISKSDYSFLSHDSHVDCSKLIIKDRGEIEEIILNRPKAVIAELEKEQIEYLRNIIKNSTTIKGKLKKRFGFYDNIC